MIGQRTLFEMYIFIIPLPRVNLLLKVMVTEHYYCLVERCNKSLPAKKDGRFWNILCCCYWLQTASLFQGTFSYLLFIISDAIFLLRRIRDVTLSSLMKIHTLVVQRNTISYLFALVYFPFFLFIDAITDDWERLARSLAFALSMLTLQLWTKPLL